MDPESLPAADAFGVVSSALDKLQEFLLHPNIDCTPIILTQPPLHRDARRAAIEQSLSVLDEQWTNMVALWQKLAQTRKQLKRRQAMCRSALSPISAMPSEILRQIFAYLFPYLPSPTDDETRRSLMHVCGEWRSIAESQKAVWSSSYLHCAPSSDKMQKLFSTSEPPLRLAIGHDLTTNKVMDFFDDAEMQQLRARVEAIHWDRLDGPDNLFYLHTIESRARLPFSALQTLSITTPQECPSCSMDYDALIAGPFTLDPEVFPNLRTLRIENVNFSSNHFGGSKLQTLELVKMSLSLYDLGRVLAGVPALEVLRLTKIGCYVPDGVYMDTNTLPVLLHLQKLVVDSIQTPYAQHLLPFLRCPHLESFVLRNTHRWNERVEDLSTEYRGDWPPNEDTGDPWYTTVRIMVSLYVVLLQIWGPDQSCSLHSSQICEHYRWRCRFGQCIMLYVPYSRYRQKHPITVPRHCFPISCH